MGQQNQIIRRILTSNNRLCFCRNQFAFDEQRGVFHQPRVLLELYLIYAVGLFELLYSMSEQNDLR